MKAVRNVQRSFRDSAAFPKLRRGTIKAWPFSSQLRQAPFLYATIKLYLPAKQSVDGDEIEMRLSHWANMSRNKVGWDGGQPRHTPQPPKLALPRLVFRPSFV